MKISRHEFKKLQRQWYSKLEQSGFVDIEENINGTDYLKEYSFKKIDPFEKQVFEEYYSFMAQFANDENTTFRNEIDQYILIRHSEGAKIKSIVDELVSRGTPRERKSVRIIIRRYEMAWGLRYYSPRQLNIKIAK